MTVGELKKKLDSLDNNTQVVINCMGMYYDVGSAKFDVTMLNKDRIVLTGTFLSGKK